MFKDLTVDVTHKIKGDQPIDQAKVLEFMKERLIRNSSGAKVETKSDGSLDFKGTLMGSQKTTGLKLQASVTTEGNSAKLHISGKPFRGPMFWFFAICWIGSIALWQYGIFWVVFTFICLPAVLKSNKMLETLPKVFVDKLVKETDSEFA
mgnify:CR=1 FL=1